MKYSLNAGGRLREVTQPLVMGIVNVTPDSFFADSRHPLNSDAEGLANAVRRMLAEGADVLDIGACSTRPGSEQATSQQEVERLAWALPIIQEAISGSDVLLSVDTYRAEVAKMAVQQYGVTIVNDVSGGMLDPDMADTVASLHCGYVLTHSRGTSTTMDAEAHYDNVTAEVLEWLARRLDDLRQRGIADIWVDPGFGFAKTLQQNYELLAQLKAFHALGAPLLVGVSRKRMVWQALGTDADHALNGTTVLNTIALLAGASVLRVHDVKAAVEARTLVAHLQNSDKITD